MKTIIDIIRNLAAYSLEIKLDAENYSTSLSKNDVFMFTYLLPLVQFRVIVELEHLPQDGRHGTPWDQSLVNIASTKTQATIHSHGHTYSQFKISNEPNACLCTPSENMQTELRGPREGRTFLLVFGFLVFLTLIVLLWFGF